MTRQVAWYRVPQQSPAQQSADAGQQPTGICVKFGNAHVGQITRELDGQGVNPGPTTVRPATASNETGSFKFERYQYDSIVVFTLVVIFCRHHPMENHPTWPLVPGMLACTSQPARDILVWGAPLSLV